MSIFSTLSNILFYGMIINLFFDRYFPTFYYNFLFDLSQFCILNYSRIQLFIDKKSRDLKKYPTIKRFAIQIRKMLEANNISGDIEIIRNNQKISYLNSTNFLEYENLEIIDKNNMEFMVYSDNTKSEKTNKVIYFDVPTNFNYECCKYKFLSLTIIFSEDEQYKLKLFSENENYYIVNNRLNKNVFSYLLMKQYGVIKNENYISYKLDIIDQDVKFKSFDEKDEILLKCYNYSVIQLSSNLIIEKEEEEEEEEEEDASTSASCADSKKNTDEELLGNDYIEVVE
jgi:hypothetical protein